MDPHAQLEDLKNTATKLSIEIEYSDLRDNDLSIQSGYCRLNHKDLIVLEKRLPLEEQIDLILGVLKRFNLDHIYIPSWIREKLESSISREISTEEK